jgi:hypothetical protein
MKTVPRWRIAAAAGVVVVLLVVCAVFVPIYYHSYQFGGFISTIPWRVQQLVVSGDPPSDKTVLEWVVSQAKGLGLPVKPANISMMLLPSDGLLEKIAVHYSVTATLPGYSVDLHFNPQSSR